MVLRELIIQHTNKIKKERLLDADKYKIETLTTEEKYAIFEALEITILEHFQTRTKYNLFTT
jgi:hypothetical protein